MHLTVCYNQENRKVAYVEAPEDFLDALLELGNCNLVVLTTLLENSFEPQPKAQNHKGDDSYEDSPLAKLAASLQSERDIPTPMDQLHIIEFLRSFVNPGSALEKLLFTPQEEVETSEEFKFCNSRKFNLYPASLATCPICQNWGPRQVSMLGFRKSCGSEHATIIPMCGGQQDLDPKLPIYTCHQSGHNFYSNVREVDCPGPDCSGRLDCNVGIIDKDGDVVHKPWSCRQHFRLGEDAYLPLDMSEAGLEEQAETLDHTKPVYGCVACYGFISNTANDPCTRCKKPAGYARQVLTLSRDGQFYPFLELPKSRERMAAAALQVKEVSEVVPPVPKEEDEKQCVLTDGLNVLNPYSVTGVVDTLKTFGVSTTTLSIALGYRELLDLARLIRIPGHDSVFSEAFDDVLDD